MVRPEQIDVLAADAARVAAAAFQAAGGVWGTEPFVPDAPVLAIKLWKMMNDLELGQSCSSGRLSVYRATEEDGVEQFNVSLDLGTVYGDDA
jgi:hypothetical protein